MSSHITQEHSTLGFREELAGDPSQASLSGTPASGSSTRILKRLKRGYRTLRTPAENPQHSKGHKRNQKKEKLETHAEKPIAVLIFVG